MAENTLLIEMRNLLVLVDRQANKLDNFLEEGSSTLAEMRTKMALMEQVQTGHSKHINEHCDLFHKGETSLRNQMIIARQEIKELLLVTSRYGALIEQISHKDFTNSALIAELRNDIKAVKGDCDKNTKAIEDKPKTNREIALFWSSWIGLSIMFATWLWDKFHK